MIYWIEVGDSNVDGCIPWYWGLKSLSFNQRFHIVMMWILDLWLIDCYSWVCWSLGIRKRVEGDFWIHKRYWLKWWRKESVWCNRNAWASPPGRMLYSELLDQYCDDAVFLKVKGHTRSMVTIYHTWMISTCFCKVCINETWFDGFSNTI